MPLQWPERRSTALPQLAVVRRSRYWLQLLANVLDVKIDVPKDGDFGAAFGAARLGLMAAEGADFPGKSAQACHLDDH